MAMPAPQVHHARPGRPRIHAERLSDYLTIKLTASQRAQLEAGAAQAGASLSAYVRAAALAAAPQHAGG